MQKDNKIKVLTEDEYDEYIMTLTGGQSVNIDDEELKDKN